MALNDKSGNNGKWKEKLTVIDNDKYGVVTYTGQNANMDLLPTDENIESFSMAIASDTLDFYTFSRYTKDEAHDDDVYGFWKRQ